MINKKDKDEQKEYFIFTNPINCIWKGDRRLVSKEKYGWCRYGAADIYNDLYQEIIPNNIRKATEEEIEYCKKNNGNLYGYKTNEDKENERIKKENENEKKEKELLIKLLKKYPEFLK